MYLYCLGLGDIWSLVPIAGNRTPLTFKYDSSQLQLVL